LKLTAVFSGNSGIFGYINYLIEKDRKYILDTLVQGWLPHYDPQRWTWGLYVINKALINFEFPQQVFLVWSTVVMIPQV